LKNFPSLGQKYKYIKVWILTETLFYGRLRGSKAVIEWTITQK
jgi:hypothetical protein